LLKELLENVDATTVMNVIKEINFIILHSFCTVLHGMS